MEITKALKEYREKHGLSLMQMARLIGVTKITVWNWEKGRYKPNQRAILDRIRGLVGRVKT